MTFNIFSLAFMIALFLPSISYGYFLSIKADNSSVGVNATTSTLSSYLGFLILKASLEKNNMPYTFSEYGYNRAVVGLEYPEVTTINNITFSVRGNVSGLGVCLWPRTTLDSREIEFDYSIVFSGVIARPEGSTDPFITCYYYDFGVVKITNWVGQYLRTNGQFDINDKNIEILGNATNTMPILFSDKGLEYFTNPRRVYNMDIRQTLHRDISEVFLGSLYELAIQVENLQYWTGTQLAYYRERDAISIQTGAYLTQDSLPWQLQIYNNDFSVEGKIQRGLTGNDTDEGTEPDWSEWYNAHDYTDPDDDWGQPADIGSGSGSSGEITNYGPHAQSQMTQSYENALDSYFGDGEIDIPELEELDYQEETNDIELDDDWLEDPIEETREFLPPAVDSLEDLIDTLKNPDNSALPTWTLSFEVNTGPIAGVIWQGVTYTIDFGRLKQDYQYLFTSLRWLAVLCLYVSIVIYVLKDNVLLGGNVGAQEGE